MRHEILSVVVIAACASEEPDTLVVDETPLYVASSALWPQPSIPVCWENAGAGDATERGWVQGAAAATWSRVAVVSFTGWEACPASQWFNGIRIRINDEGPHVKALGNGLRGMLNGMVLNFAFASWGSSCQSMREFCIRAIAVHEFGHALGFAHEQNRPDRPSNCIEPAQGSSGDVMFGVWDLRSVMNYCNPSWNGDGKLSLTDIRGAQIYYGVRAGLQIEGFHPAYYLQYGDLTNAFGAFGHMDAVSHWLQFGMSQGRAGTPGFSPAFYLERYPDLQAAFGITGYIDGATHWSIWGVDQGRTSSPAFDVAFYLRANADLRAAFGAAGHRAALTHWNEIGLGDGRLSSPAFHVKYYLARYPDLVAAFGPTNYDAALRHFLLHGLSEGRAASPAFDAAYYLARYPDLQAVYGAHNHRWALLHWLMHGIAEGRRGSAELDPVYYLAANPDVAAVYGSHSGAIEHYLVYGRNEGRRGAAP